MKILHTADWHIGKSLYKQSLSSEIKLFFQWLLQTVQDEEIDLVLVSGDIFDLANPSHADQAIYYSVLLQLHDLGVHCIITGGNHDSASMLEAPSALIAGMGINVVAYGQDVERQIVTFQARDGEKLHILAVPYLRDGDLRHNVAGESRDEKAESIRQAMIAHYMNLLDQAKLKDDSIPVIGMGHLYMQGASTSDSERDIQMGNLAGLSVEHFQQAFDYMALGHIHKPQKLNKTGTIRYSGSPIALSFSEIKDQKQVLIIEIQQHKITDICEKHIPLFRPLVRFSGNVQTVRQKLSQYQSPGILPAFVEIQVLEEKRDSSKVLETIAMAEQESTEYEIINYKIAFEERIQSLFSSDISKRIEEMAIRDVLRQRLDQEELSQDLQKEIMMAFDEVTQDMELDA